jgi:hypothetical protein
MHGTYYVPSGKSGETVLSDCYHSIGFPNTYKLRFSGFRGYVSNSLYDRGNKVTLSLIIYIDKDKDKLIELKSKTVDINIGDKKLKYNINKIIAWNYGEAGGSKDGTLFGFHDITSQMSFSGFNVYELTTELDIPYNEFTAKLPLLIIGHEVIDIGEIHFIKKSSTVIMTINC